MQESTIEVYLCLHYFSNRQIKYHKILIDDNGKRWIHIQSFSDLNFNPNGRLLMEFDAESLLKSYLINFCGSAPHKSMCKNVKQIPMCLNFLKCKHKFIRNCQQQLLFFDFRIFFSFLPGFFFCSKFLQFSALLMFFPSFLSCSRRH